MGITKGKIDLPWWGVLFGQGGVGKSTFLAGDPVLGLEGVGKEVVFVATEPGTNGLDVSRHDVAKTYDQLVANIKDKDNHAFNYICFDTLTAMEPLVVQKVVEDERKIKGDKIKDFSQVRGGFDRQHQALAEQWDELLTLIYTEHVLEGRAVLFLAHESMHKVKEADQEAYYRWEPDLMPGSMVNSGTAMQIFRKVDFQWYAYFEKTLKGVDFNTVTQKASRKVAIGGERRLRVLPTPSVLVKQGRGFQFDADVIDFSWSAVKHLLW